MRKMRIPIIPDQTQIWARQAKEGVVPAGHVLLVWEADQCVIVFPTEACNLHDNQIMVIQSCSHSNQYRQEINALHDDTKLLSINLLSISANDEITYQTLKNVSGRQLWCNGGILDQGWFLLLCYGLSLVLLVADLVNRRWCKKKLKNDVNLANG